MADTVPKPVAAAPNQVSSASAYKLQDKAKDLKVEDLQNLEDKANPSPLGCPRTMSRT
jgi:hypothetical protein